MESRNVLIEGLHFVGSPMWTIHPLYSDNVVVRDVIIETYSGVHTDGVAVDSSRNVRISNCYIDMRSTRPPLLVQRRNCAGKYDVMTLFKSPFPNSVIRARRLCMAIRTERHAGIVGSFLPHAAIRAGMSGFAPAFDPAADARHLTDPGQIGWVSGRSLAGWLTTLTL
jgi:hypothetical protein